MRPWSIGSKHEKDVALTPENPREFFNYIKLDESCKYFFEDGLKLTAFADRSLFETEIHDKTYDNPHHKPYNTINQGQSYY